MNAVSVPAVTASAGSQVTPMRGPGFVNLCVTRNWYVVGWTHELGAEPLARLVCGRRLAMFRDSQGRACAVDATCPHRGADLAQGQVSGDSLACPFHGIAFDGAGRCTRVPSQSPADPISDRLRIASYPVREAGGLLWVWPESAVEPTFEPRLPEFLSLPHPWRRVVPRTTLCAGSYLNSLENALDDSHLAFVHRTTIPGAPCQVARYRIAIAKDRRSYFGEAQLELTKAAEIPTAKSRSGLGAGSRIHDLIERFAFDQLVQVARRVDYDLSGLVCYTVDYADGHRDHTFAFFTPGDEQRTWMTGGIVRNHSLNRVADSFLDRFMRRLMAEDVGAMSLLVPEARGPGGLSPPFVVPADRSSVPFRRLYGQALRAEGKTPPWAMDSSGADPL